MPRSSRLLPALTAVVGAALALSGLVVPADATSGEGRDSVTFVTRQLRSDGGVPGPMGNASDWGLTIDTMLAAIAVGGHDKQVNQMWQGISRHAVDYAGPSYGSTRGGASAKVVLAALAVGEDPTSIPVSGGRRVDMVAQTRSLIERTPGTRRGRLSDRGAQEANVFGQSLAVMAFSRKPLVGRYRADAQLLVDHLLTQQCHEGYWRMYSSDGKTCDEADPRGTMADTDGSAMALMALRGADRAGLDVPDSAMTRGIADLERRQHRDGSFGGGVSTEAPNANSTGLAGDVLALYGRGKSAASAKAYVLSLRVGPSGAPTGSGEGVGAIAYNADSLAAAQKEGIGVSADQWRRTTSQAVLVLAPASYVDLSHEFAAVSAPRPTAGRPAAGASPGPGRTPGARPTGSRTPASSQAPQPSVSRPASTTAPQGAPAQTSAPRGTPSPVDPAEVDVPLPEDPAGTPVDDASDDSTTDDSAMAPGATAPTTTGPTASPTYPEPIATRALGPGTTPSAQPSAESGPPTALTAVLAVLIGGGLGGLALVLTRRRGAAR